MAERPKNPYDAAAETKKAFWVGLSMEAKNEYIEKYSPLIKYLADRLAARLPAHISKDDLISSGILGLIDAVDKFDPNRNILFKTYAEFRVKGAMIDELRNLDWVPRTIRKKANQVEKLYQNLERELGREPTDEEAAAALGLDMPGFIKLLDEIKIIGILDLETLKGTDPKGGERRDIYEVLADESALDALSALGLEETRRIIGEAIEQLPEKERLVITLYYYEELTMKEIGQVLGYTESRISQLHTKCMLRLRTRLRRHFEPA